jgi:heme-degrading monooxygenase HmoA
MVWVLNRIEVHDYAEWRDYFDRGKPLRESWGQRSQTVYRQKNEPSAVVVLLEWDDADRADKFFQSDEFHKRTEEAGVKVVLENLILEEA